MFPRLHHMYTMPAYIESYNLSYYLGPWSMALGHWFLQGPCNDSSCIVFSTCLHGPWLLVLGSCTMVLGMLVQVANGCRIETWAVMAHGWLQGGIYCHVAKKMGYRRRGSRWDSNFLMILYIYIYI